MRAGRRACVGLMLLVLAACGSPAGPPPETPAPVARRHSGRLPEAERAEPAPRSVVHVVSRGETLYRISKRYGSSVEAIVSANAISDVHNVPVGARLVVPAGGGGAGPRRSVDAGTYASRDPRGRSAGPANFAWPLHGVVISEFGLRRGAHHDGLDI